MFLGKPTQRDPHSCIVETSHQEFKYHNVMFLVISSTSTLSSSFCCISCTKCHRGITTSSLAGYKQELCTRSTTTKSDLSPKRNVTCSSSSKSAGYPDRRQWFKLWLDQISLTQCYTETEDHAEELHCWTNTRVVLVSGSILLHLESPSMWRHFLSFVTCLPSQLTQAGSYFGKEWTAMVVVVCVGGS